MKILVANLGSTSFKYRLYDLGAPSEPLLARGAVERIGSESAKVTMRSAKGEAESVEPVLDHGKAVELCLEQLTSSTTGVLASADEVAAIGFKAVHARHVSGVQKVDSALLDAMDAYSGVAPAHNPPYVKAMRMLLERFPSLPQVAAFETGFHMTIPEARRRYAIPEAWTNDVGVQKFGFHGASHRYIGGRMAELLGRTDARVISCHLGGSSSLCAIEGGKSIATSMGMSPQSGLPQNNRVGDFDVFALPAIMESTGLGLSEVLDTLANKSGLLGICGFNDLRDIENAAGSGEGKASLALDVYVDSIRHYLGALLVHLGGADAIAFTGGIGENSSLVRERVLRNLGWVGIEIDESRNKSGDPERVVTTTTSKVQAWCVPTNEEIVVARQTRDLLTGKGA